MKTTSLSLLFILLFSLTATSQDFGNKIGLYSVSWNKKIRLDYIENRTDFLGNKTTILFLKYIPKPDDFELTGFNGIKYMKIVDKHTGKEYKLINGNGITKRSDAKFYFHNKGGEIGFSLSFEQIPSTVTDIDIVWYDSKFFKNIKIDAESNDEDFAYNFEYFFRSLSFYTTIPGLLYFSVEGTMGSDMTIELYYPESEKPKECGASGTITFAFSQAMKDRDIKIQAQTSKDNERKAFWNFTEKPQAGSCEYIRLK